jgi:hypothetical protein
MSITSLKLGIEFAAPNFVMQRKAAAEANFWLELIA